jgi:hypothetical protein
MLARDAIRVREVRVSLLSLAVRSDADAFHNSGPNPDGDSNREPLGDPDSYADGDPDRGADSYADSYADGNAHERSYGDPDSYADRKPDSDSIAHDPAFWTAEHRLGVYRHEHAPRRQSDRCSAKLDRLGQRTPWDHVRRIGYDHSSERLVSLWHEAGAGR